MERLTARELFDKVSTRLALRWVAGQQGENRAIVPAEKQARRPSLVGYLNAIYPNKVQIIGTEELFSVSVTCGQFSAANTHTAPLRSSPRIDVSRT